jgi:beta-lactamase superfamily II metal-dependent hydrolase
MIMVNVEMIIWDVQHGNAIYVKTPNDKHLVFDLGIGDYSGKNESFSPLATLWYKHGVRKLHYVMVTHPHLDHIDDILNLGPFAPSVFSRPRHIAREDIMKDIRDQDRPKFDKYFEFHNTYIRDIAGTSDDTSIPDNYGGLKLKFFHTPSLPKDNINNHSLITVLEYSGIKIIVPGDNEFPSLDLLMKQDDFKTTIKDADILLAPHHGRESAYHDEFVTHVNPRLTVISDGSICDTSANPKYSAKSRGWKVWKKGTTNSTDRRLLTTNSDGEIYVSFGPSTDPSFTSFLSVSIE